MLIILRPGIAAIGTGALLVTGAAALWAAAMIIIKILSRTESSLINFDYNGDTDLDLSDLPFEVPGHETLTYQLDAMHPLPDSACLHV